MSLLTTTPIASGFPLVIPTQTQSPTARLVLRNDLGQVIQQWLVKQIKCTLGSAASCSLRCELPRIAPYHALLVIGARQIFIRALAPKLTRDGRQFNEILLTDENSHFEIAGHRFELARTHQLSTEPSRQATPANTERLKFTLARPFELSNRRSASPKPVSPIPVLEESKPQHESKIATQTDSKWVAQLIQAAIQPIECQLHNLIEPLTELQSESRRQQRLRKKKRIAKQNRHAAQIEKVESTGQVNAVEQLLSVQVEEIVGKQAASMAVLTERISDVNMQLTTIERIIAEDRNLSDQKLLEEAQNSTLLVQNTAIEQVQTGIVAVSAALESLQSKQSHERGEITNWQAGVQQQLELLTQVIDNMTGRFAEIVETVQQTSELVVARSQSQQPTERPIHQSLSPIAEQSIELRPIEAPVGLTSAPEFVQVPEHRLLQSEHLAERQLHSTNLEHPTASNAGDRQQVESSPWPVLEQTVSSVPVDWNSPVVDDEFAAMTQGMELAQEANQNQIADSAASQAPAQPAAPVWESPSQTEPIPAANYNEEFLFGGISAEVLEHPLAPTPQWPAWSERAVSGTEDAAVEGLVNDGYLEQLADVPHTPEILQSDYRLNSVAHDERSAADEIMDEAQVASDPVGALPSWWVDDGEDRNTQDTLAAAELDFSNPHANILGYESNQGFEDQVAERELLKRFSDAFESTATPSAAPTSISSAVEPANHPESEEFFGLGAIASDVERESFSDAAAPPAEILPERAAEPEFYGLGAESGSRHVEKEEDSLLDGLESNSEVEVVELQAEPMSAGLSANDELSDVEEDSVEDYMKKLLARMRGVPEEEVELPKSQQSPAKPVAELNPTRNERPTAPPLTVGVTSAPTTQNTFEDITEPFDPEKYMPRALAPEQSKNLAAMRELANSSARTAIHKSTRQRHLSSILLKAAISFVGLVVGAVLIGINGLNVNIGLVATVASFFVGVIWGYDAITSIKPLLQAGLVLKPQTDSRQQATEAIVEE